MYIAPSAAPHVRRRAVANVALSQRASPVSQLLTVARIIPVSCAAANRLGNSRRSAVLPVWESGFRRVIGIIGCIVAFVPVAALLSGAMRLNVLGMSAVVVLQGIWNLEPGSCATVMSPANDRPWDCQRLSKKHRLARMKRLAGIAAILLVAAAHSQTSSPPAVAADVNTATVYIREAWNDFTHCRRPSACNAYFDTFGVAIPFTDGSIVPFTHIQRLGATSRDCIKTARTSLDQGDRSLAVQWVMAARIENQRVRDWLGSHPDAVVEALRRCCS